MTVRKEQEILPVLCSGQLGLVLYMASINLFAPFPLDIVVQENCNK